MLAAGDHLKDDREAAQEQRQASGLQESPLPLKISWEQPHLQLQRWLLPLTMPRAVAAPLEVGLTAGLAAAAAAPELFSEANSS